MCHRHGCAPLAFSEPPTTTDSTKEREFHFLDAALFNRDQH
jgi:hypothetical protein